MATKSDILNNLREYTADQIAEAIKSGVVTMYELSKSGNLTPLMRRRIEERLAAKSTETFQSAPEVTQTTEVDNSNSLGKSSSDNIEIPKAMDTIIASENEIPEATVVADDSNHAFEPTEQGQPSTSDISEKSQKEMFKHPFSFKGRIRRTEYGISFIIFSIWDTVLNVMLEPQDPPMGAFIFGLVSFIPMIWFWIAQNTKRCHDRGNSGWYQLIPFYAFVLLFGDGEHGSNKYGDNPKE